MAVVIKPDGMMAKINVPPDGLSGAMVAALIGSNWMRAALLDNDTLMLIEAPEEGQGQLAETVSENITATSIWLRAMASIGSILNDDQPKVIRGRVVVCSPNDVWPDFLDAVMEE